MDARTHSNATAADAPEEDRPTIEPVPSKRDRLLASLSLIVGAGFFVSLPFALRAGAEFFLPITAALVIAIALVPQGCA